MASLASAVRPIGRNTRPLLRALAPFLLAVLMHAWGTLSARAELFPSGEIRIFDVWDIPSRMELGMSPREPGSADLWKDWLAKR